MLTFNSFTIRQQWSNWLGLVAVDTIQLMFFTLLAGSYLVVTKWYARDLRINTQLIVSGLLLGIVLTMNIMVTDVPFSQRFWINNVFTFIIACVMTSGIIRNRAILLQWPTNDLQRAHLIWFGTFRVYLKINLRIA